MANHLGPEAGSFRIAPVGGNHGDTRTILQSHATDLRLAGKSTLSSPPLENNSFSLPISPVTDLANLPVRRILDAYRGQTTAVPAPIKALDTAKSPSELAKDGTIKDGPARTTDGTQKVLAANEQLEAGKAPKLKVQFSDITAQSKVKPDFVVKQDGSVLMMNDPEKTNQKGIVVEVERANGQLMPNEAQQQSVDELVKYLDARIKQRSPEAKQNGLNLDDPQDLVSRNVEQEAHVKQERQMPRDFPPQAEEQGQRLNRFRGGGSGQMSRPDADDYFPERSVPRQKNESDPIAAMKDVVAGFTSRGSEAPYEHVVHRGNRGWGVGRYGLTYDMISSWLSNLDVDGLEQLEKEGKVPKGTAAKMKKMKASVAKSKESGKDSDLDPFLQKLKAGDQNNPVTASDITDNFGKEVQELAADHNVGKFTGLMGRQTQSVEPGQLALAMMLGHVPTEEDLSTPENKRFVDSATQSYQIALNRYTTPEGSPVDFADTSKLTQAMKNAVGKQLWQGYAQDTEYGNLGCAITVSRILRAGGLDIGDQLAVDGVARQMKRIGAEKVSLNEAVQSGKPYVIIKKEGGSHTGIGLGDTVVENSSDSRRTVARNLSNSTLRSGSYAYIIPKKG